MVPLLEMGDKEVKVGGSTYCSHANIMCASNSGLHQSLKKWLPEYKDIWGH